MEQNEQLYFQYRKMILSSVWKRVKSYGQSFDDLLGDAHVIFCNAVAKYDDSRGANFGTFLTYSQNVGSSPEYIKALTSEWTGERFADGRPKVSDAILERLKNISIEEAWSVLKNKGYLNQFEGEYWHSIEVKLLSRRICRGSMV